MLKYPGDLNGKQFKLEENKRCEIYVNDYNAGGFVDKCEDSIIFWAPSTSSVFVRNCKNCRFVIICQQLRLRDCHDCEIMLFSQTDPILESSSNIKYYCANFVYPELKSHMASCNISIWNNTWSDQFDFTPNKDGGPNFKFIDEDGDGFIDSFKAVTQNIMIIQAQKQDPTLDLSNIDLNFEDEQVPLIPITTGNIAKPAKCHAFVLFLASDGETVYQIYEYLYFTYFKNKRDQYWLKGKVICLLCFRNERSQTH